jgi:hypothetical protein
MYKLMRVNDISGKLDMIKKIDSNYFIPVEEQNYDYQEYLKWVAEGNTPEPADSE